jgi:flagellar protein FlaF
MMKRNALDTYKKIEITTNSPRAIEARALTVGAQKLICCRDNWESERCKTLLAEALKYNQKLWSIFQSNLANPGNPLPRQLKLNLLVLGAYVDRQIFRIMAYPSPEKLTSIIDINLGIAEGLRSKPVAVSNPLSDTGTDVKSPIDVKV